MEIEVHSGPHVPQPLFDWQLDVERLERETRAALHARKCDPLTLAEAECSLDLIDAELVTARSSKGVLDEGLAQLEEWRTRLVKVIGKLESLPT